MKPRLLVRHLIREVLPFRTAGQWQHKRGNPGKGELAISGTFVGHDISEFLKLAFKRWEVLVQISKIASTADIIE